MEIRQTIDRLKRDLPYKVLQSVELFPLHSNLTAKEQQTVFRRMPAGIRKVVVSTNIAETSVTIDDVVFIIDTGRVKEMKLINNILTLDETWASRAACKQRRGRAGRVRDGFCYKLFSRKFESKKMSPSTIPEMYDVFKFSLRLPLEQLCLHIKSLGINDVHHMLAKAINAPPITAVDKAVETLTSVKAIHESTGQLTSLGKHISLIPADIKIAKMILYERLNADLELY
jgi:HrpA-like RNA helicase